MGVDEWTITRAEDVMPFYTDYAFAVRETGSVDSGRGEVLQNAIRPAFYLNSNITFVSGTGTRSNPYRIK